MAINLALRCLRILCSVTQTLLGPGEEGAVGNQLSVRVECHSETRLVGQVDTSVDWKRFIEKQVTERWVNRLSVWRVGLEDAEVSVRRCMKRAKIPTIYSQKDELGKVMIAWNEYGPLPCGTTGIS